MYTWNSAELWNAAILPKKAGDALKVATFTQLKVLLFAATCGKPGIDAAACAKAIGGRVSVADCADALRFWEAEGVLMSTDGDNTAPAAPIVPPPAPRAATPVPPPAPAVKTVTAADVATAKAVKPRKNRKEFLELLRSVESRFGKTLSRADQDRLMDLVEETELPMEVLLMIVAYTVKNDKKRVSYIQAVAKDWAEQGITTIAAADKHLCFLERREKSWNKLVAWLALDTERPTVSQKNLADKWIYEYKQKQPLIALAYEKCLAKTGKFQAVYMDRLLTAWHDEGLTTPEKVTAPKSSAGKTPAKKGDGGFDVEKYEKLVAERTPHFRKKG